MTVPHLFALAACGVVGGGPTPGVAGYVGGGTTGSNTNRIEKFTFSTETIATLGATLSSSRRLVAGFSDTNVAGYAAGGFTTGRVATVDKLTYSSDTVATLGAGLPSSRYAAFGWGDPGVYGYTVSGITTVNISDITRTLFSTDVMSACSTSWTVMREGHGASDVGVAGYGFGGYTSSAQTVARKMGFASETQTNMGSALSQSRATPSCVANPAVAMYVMGGYNGATTYYDSVEKYALPSETRSTLGGTLSDTGGGAQSVESHSVSGFKMGNQRATLAEIEELDFATDTLGPHATSLSTGAYYGAGFSDQG
jgi:hypothetical protein